MKHSLAAILADDHVIVSGQIRTGPIPSPHHRPAICSGDQYAFKRSITNLRNGGAEETRCPNFGSVVIGGPIELCGEYSPGSMLKPRLLAKGSVIDCIASMSDPCFENYRVDLAPMLGPKL